MNWNDFVGMAEVAEDVPSDYLIERIRHWRNIRLMGTDWTQLPDAPTDKAVYAIYRQGLRDLMAQSEDARELVFPVEP